MLLRRFAPLALSVLAAAAPVGLAGQSGPIALNAPAMEGAEGGARGAALSLDDLSGTALGKGRYAVVIDLDENRLSFRKGDLTLWSAPIGTGTGLRLEKGDKAWDFSTPNGVFHVQYKEENPVWIAEDWYYIENHLPVPPPNDRSRYFPGGLGAAAVYIGHDLAIHGTDKPELLGQRVSHGCIRLANKDALRLFHNVQVGTEVIIVGGQRAAEEAAKEASLGGAATFNPLRPKQAPKDPVLEGWKAMPTEDLLAVLDNEIWLDSDVSRWTEVASLLLNRGLGSDDEALAGLFAALGNLPSARVEREYATFLADAYQRAPVRTVEVLGALERPARERAAAAVVGATMELYNGEFADPTAPWPSRRLPGTALAAEDAAGWRALTAAESAFRARGGTERVRSTI